MKKILIIILSEALIVLAIFGIIKVKNRNGQSNTNSIQMETLEEIKQTEDKVEQQKKMRKQKKK